MTPAARAAYRAAYASAAARAWIESLPPSVRKQAEKKGLLKPYYPEKIHSIPLILAATNSGNDFDENDFAFAAVESGGNLDGIRAEFYAAAEPEESPEE